LLVAFVIVRLGGFAFQTAALSCFSLRLVRNQTARLRSCRISGRQKNHRNLENEASW
jgi:hypothetical protein